MELIDHAKPIIEDKEFSADVSGQNLSRQVLRRVFAVNKTFIGVRFEQSEISECYFRNCRFIRCDFTGTSIRRSNFRGSQYEECKFLYSTWEHTQLDDEFLDNCLPSEENLARDLVRSLRVNFGHIGNYSAVNKAAAIEVRLAGQHLFHAAYSKQSYYRSKYKGWSRALQAVRHVRWKALDLLWGNGESIVRVILAAAFAVFLWGCYIAWSNPSLSWSQSLVEAAYAFWGIGGAASLPRHQLALPTVVRFVLFGLFMAILVKRLAHR
jgi:hypothetical protein